MAALYSARKSGKGSSTVSLLGEACKELCEDPGKVVRESDGVTPLDSFPTAHLTPDSSYHNEAQRRTFRSYTSGKYQPGPQDKLTQRRRVGRRQHTMQQIRGKQIMEAIVDPRCVPGSPEASPRHAWDAGGSRSGRQERSNRRPRWSLGDGLLHIMVSTLYGT